MSLSEIRSPQDLKRFSVQELEMICAEIRHEIISATLKNGGHIGASLGAVEIAVALHRIFESPKEALVWDVGHQAYAHKLLTGRLDRFNTLRLKGGLSGFLTREESEHDVYGAGHSSTSLSAAMGFAYKNPDWTVAIIGDGALTAGVAFEALNHLHQFQNQDLGPLLIVLNDNQMSISENVGAIPNLLSQGLASEYFGLFGVETVGPVNGHDLPELLATLNGIKESRPRSPILLHVLTQKGKGYGPAEIRPSTFHGVSPAQVSERVEKAPAPDEPRSRTWSEVFCRALMDEAEKDPKVIAITAAMGEGTGLLPFADRFPGRYIDVGIAEPHAVTLAAGLAARGWKPVVAIYSTFLQRGIDALIHDVALQNLNVTFCVDRAGIVGTDGPTHHGMFDLVYSTMVPGLEVFAPATAGEMKVILSEALASSSPTFIRYPRGKASEDPSLWQDRWRRAGSERPSKILIGVGPAGLRVESLVKRIPELTVITLEQVKPFPATCLSWIHSQSQAELYSLEDGVIRGGVGEALASALQRDISKLGYPDRFIPHGQISELEKDLGLDLMSIEKRLTSGSTL